MVRRALPILVAFLLSTAHAAVDFGIHTFSFADFRDADDVAAACQVQPSSFWCGLQDQELTRIPTKGVDLFIDATGEVVAAYAKPQKGQVLNNYNLGNNQNLIPATANIPGAALLLDGQYLEREIVSSEWEQVSETLVQGTFVFRAGPLDVTKVVRVSNISHTVEVDLAVTRTEAGTEAVAVQLAYPGIGNVTSPVLKVGQGLGDAGSFAINPLSQPVASPSYISLQNNDRNTAFAIILMPGSSEAIETLQAMPLPPRQVALQRSLAPESGASTTLDIRTYLGPNELVRYDQEGYVDLPGLFRPNILGRLSLGILWVLKSIHDYVGNWGISIIILTLLFRALVWPLINTQTKSMFGMQELQPKIQALQKKYKDDRETLTQETMKLYREAGVNPAGGCLPILLQMPLFIILWRVFVNFEFGEGFLWVPDLGQADPFYILPILYIAVMFGMSWFSARGNPQSLRQQILINVVFAFILFGFPAGVLLYFVVSMSIQVLQYWLIQRGKAPVTAKA